MKLRKIVTFGLGITVAVSSVLVCGSAELVDVKLQNAEAITKKIFVSNAKMKSGNVNEKLYQMNAEYLMGLDGEKDYVLVQQNGGGYAIFDRESMELMEYSDDGESPYCKAGTSEIYYAGPANYYHKKGGEVTNLFTGEKVGKEHLSAVANNVQEKIKTDSINRKDEQEKQEKERQEKQKAELQDFDSVGVYSQAEMGNLSVAPGPTGSQTQDADSYTALARRYISNYIVLKNNVDHGYNLDGTCASVAAQILLAYNNLINDARIIPTNDSPLLQKDEQFFNNGRENYYTKPYSRQMIATNSSNESTDEKISLFRKLREYINPDSCFRDTCKHKDANGNQTMCSGATLAGIKNGINSFLTQYSPAALAQIIMSYRYDNAGSINNLLQTEVHNGRPAIAFIWTYSENKDDTYTKEGHFVVVYGYQTIQYNGIELNGLIANFGLNEGDTHIWYNGDWTRGLLTFASTHTHSTNNGEALDSNNHVFLCDVCEGPYIRGYHIIKQKSKFASTDVRYHNSHQIRCDCEYVYEEEHQLYYQELGFAYSEEEKDTYHFIVCDCGYIKKEEHYFKYKDCLLCGYYPY